MKSLQDQITETRRQLALKAEEAEESTTQHHYSLLRDVLAWTSKVSRHQLKLIDVYVSLLDAGFPTSRDTYYNMRRELEKDGFNVMP